MSQITKFSMFDKKLSEQASTKAGADRSSLSRRRLLGVGLGTAGVMISSAALAATPTPGHPEGPFKPMNLDNDLTRTAGGTGKAKGQVIVIKGKVMDENDRPIGGALVDIWQASANGKYNHPGDPNTGDVDRNFQYWGRDTSDANGEYVFKSIIPGTYPVPGARNHKGEPWERPPHIHWEISRRGHHQLTTQTYFAGNSLNDDDSLLRRLPKAQQSKLIIDFKPVNNVAGEEQVLVGDFNIVLRKIG